MSEAARGISFVALMMEAVQTCETLAKSCQSTRRYNTEDGHLQAQLICVHTLRWIISHI
jgi:hypothetical protein